VVFNWRYWLQKTVASLRLGGKSLEHTHEGTILFGPWFVYCYLVIGIVHQVLNKHKLQVLWLVPAQFWGTRPASCSLNSNQFGFVGQVIETKVWSQRLNILREINMYEVHLKKGLVAGSSPQNRDNSSLKWPGISPLPTYLTLKGSEGDSSWEWGWHFKYMVSQRGIQVF